VAQQKIAGVKCLRLEGGAVTRDEEPMADLISQELDLAEGREFAAEFWVCWVRALRENEPNTVVARGFGRIPEHANDAVVEVDGKTGEHATHLGVQRHERIHNERVRRFRFWWAGHDFYGLSEWTETYQTWMPVDRWHGLPPFPR